MLFDRTPRRGFLAGLGALAATWAAAGPTAADTGARAAPDPDQWLDRLTGKYRQLFDFNTHQDGLPLMHMHNYLETLKSAYGVAAGDINAVGTFYGSTTALGWNHDMWAKYKMGTALNLTDPETKAPLARNWFYQPKKTDPVFFNGLLTAASIENHLARGSTFILCANALRNWTIRLSGMGFGQPEEIGADIRANLIPGVVVVPAMVVAVGQAQKRGLTYMRT